MSGGAECRWALRRGTAGGGPAMAKARAAASCPAAWPLPLAGTCRWCTAQSGRLTRDGSFRRQAASLWAPWEPDPRPGRGRSLPGRVGPRLRTGGSCGQRPSVPPDPSKPGSFHLTPCSSEWVPSTSYDTVGIQGGPQLQAPPVPSQTLRVCRPHSHPPWHPSLHPVFADCACA